MLSQAVHPQQSAGFLISILIEHYFFRSFDFIKLDAFLRIKFLSFFEHPNVNANNKIEQTDTIKVIHKRNNEGSILLITNNEGNKETIETSKTLTITLCMNLLIGNATIRFNIYTLKVKQPNAIPIETTNVYSGEAPNLSKI